MRRRLLFPPRQEGGNTGFTMLEIAIVVVIIGLLTGGVLLGLSIVRESELRSVTAELDSYQQALKQFHDKYNQFPGDMYNATDFWTAGTCPATSWNTPLAPTCNGNGDTKISARHYDAASLSTFQESFLAWQHLRNAGFIDDPMSGAPGPSGSGNEARPGFNVPKSKMGGVGYMLYHLTCRGCGAFYAAEYGHVLQAGRPGTAPDDEARTPFLSPAEALSIDTKIDDGSPAYGKLLTPPGESACVSSTTQTDAHYLATSDERGLCSLLLITGL